MKKLFIILCALLVLSPFTTNAYSEWDLSQWYLYNEPCANTDGTTLTMQCVSTALVSNTRYNGAMTISVEVKANAAQGSSSSRYWASLALDHDMRADNLYASAAITKGIAPFWGTRDVPYSVMLVDGGDECCFLLTTAEQETWHTLQIIYSPGLARICVDGHCGQSHIDIKEYSIALLCVGVDPGESGGGSIAHCEFRNLQINNLPGNNNITPELHIPTNNNHFWDW